MAFPIVGAQEIWVSVNVYGPQAEIDRFKATCLIPSVPDSDDDEPATIEFIKVTPDIDKSSYGSDYDFDEPIHNFRDDGDSPGSYYFAFDVFHRFLTVMFENHAAAFSSLAFSCECITSMDEFMGFGWFNVPDGGEPFDFYDVPEDYWTEGNGYKRDPITQARHLVVLGNVARAAGKASRH